MEDNKSKIRELLATAKGDPMSSHEQHLRLYVAIVIAAVLVIFIVAVFAGHNGGVLNNNSSTTIYGANEPVSTISKDVAGEIRTLVGAISYQVAAESDKSKSKARSEVYRELKSRYGVTSYKDIPADRGEDALMFLSKKMGEALIDRSEILNHLEGHYLKRVAKAEAPNREYSNAHEFTRLSSLKSFMGIEKKVYKAAYLWLGQDGFKKVSGEATWYDARREGEEYRLYYTDNEVTSAMSYGDLVVISKGANDKLVVIVAEKGSDAEHQVRSLFNGEQGGQIRLSPEVKAIKSSFLL